jgi:glycerol-3-phosphate dehydrogenase
MLRGWRRVALRWFAVNSETTKLGPMERAAGLKRAQDEVFDVLVIGGGVTGAGAALDAASRGLSVCLVERRDFAAGTSSRSSKLVHGGLRYLEQFDFGLVREALRERRTLIEDVAPHLVRPARFLLPLQKHYERAYIGAGVLLYDVLAGRHSAVPRHRHLSHKSCLELAPSLNPKSLVGGIQYYDAQIDDARHTVVVARTAASFGAVCLTGISVDRILVEGGRAVGVEVNDRESDTDATFAIRARVVINATGVWTSELERGAGVSKPLQVRASKGMHVLVPRDRVASGTAMILRTEKSVLFVIPWGDRWIIGTTDTDWTYDLEHPSASASDVRYVLKWANSVLKDPLTEADVIGVYAGLRPLISGGESATTKLSREHAINHAMPGLVSIAGGKYTTYRLMGRDAVDACASELGQTLPNSDTHNIALLGAQGHDTALRTLSNHAGAIGMAADVLAHLVARYGSTASEVLDVIAADPATGTPLPGDDRGTETQINPDVAQFDTGHRSLSIGGRYLLAEAVHAVTHEGALHVDDVLTRRTRLSIEGNDRGLAAAPVVARAVGAVLGWSEQTEAVEVAHYVSRVAAERDAQTQLDDAGADAARRPIRDLRLLSGHA